MKRTLILAMVKYVVGTYDGQHPPVKTKRKLAEAIKATFPRVYPEIDVLLPNNSRNGKLGTAFNNAVKRLEVAAYDAMDDSEMDVSSDGSERENQGNEDDEEMSEDENEDQEEIGQAQAETRQDGEGIMYLRTVVPTRANKPVIIRYLNETVEYRRNKILDGSTSYFLDLYWFDASYILCDFDALWPELSGKFDGEVLDKFQRFIITLKHQMKKKMDVTLIINDETSPFQTLVILLGRVIGGAAKAAKSFVREIHAQASPDQVADTCRVSTEPFIVIKTSNPPQYIINLDGKPIYLDTDNFRTFHQAFDLLIKVYFVFNIAYPKNLKKFYTFFSASIYGLTNVPKDSPTLLEISEKFNGFENSDATETEDENNDENSESDVGVEGETDSESDETDTATCSDDEESDKSHNEASPLEPSAVSP